MASQPAVTAREQQLAQAFYGQFGVSPTQDQVVAFAAWLRSESGTSGNSYHNPLNVGGGGPGSLGTSANGFNVYPSDVAGVEAAAQRLKQYDTAANPYGYSQVVAAIKSGDTATFVDAVTRSSWDKGHYGAKVIHGFLESHLISRFYAMGGTGGTNPGAQAGGAIGGAVAPVAGAVGGAVSVLGFGAQVAQFVADPQHWIDLLAFAGGVLAVGIGGYMLWSSTGGGGPSGVGTAVKAVAAG